MASAAKLFKRLKAARLDNTLDYEMRRLATVELLILDDFALQPPRSHRDHRPLRAVCWSAPKLPDSPSNRMDVWKGEVIAPTEEELLTGIQG